MRELITIALTYLPVLIIAVGGAYMTFDVMENIK